MAKLNKQNYLDILKVLEVGGEGGGETLYRVLPYGSAQFSWRRYASGLNLDENDEEIWESHEEEFEDVAEYLMQRETMLPWLVPLHIDLGFQKQIFAALLKGIRTQNTQSISEHLFRDAAHWGRDGYWADWQKLLQLQSTADGLCFYSAFGKNPISELRVDAENISTVQELLNPLHRTLLADLVPTGTYGTKWQIFDLVNIKQLDLPRDDRNDILAAVGIHRGAGGLWQEYKDHMCLKQ